MHILYKPFLFYVNFINKAINLSKNLRSSDKTERTRVRKIILYLLNKYGISNIK